MKNLNRHTAPGLSLRPERILQFGAGNFLRGFVDWMVQVLNEETDFEGSVVIIKPTLQGDYEALRRQEGLFHTILSGTKDGVEFEDIKLIDCISRIIHPYNEFAEFLKCAENPELNVIISNTTESGINFSEKDTSISEPAETFPGKLTQWLYHRFKLLGDVHTGCTLLPCELIEDNANQLRTCVLQYARHWQLGQSFQHWIETELNFCNTLVDRIVTGYPGDAMKEIHQKISYHDHLLVAGEHYHSWVIESSPLLLEILPFDQTHLEVQLVEDLRVHRQIKVRILNGLHTAMVPVGYLNGQRTVREVMENAKMAYYLEQLLATEILPGINYDPAKLRAYADAILERFRNPAMEHKLSSIALNSIAKFRTRLLPSLKDHIIRTEKSPPYILRALAALLLFYRGTWKNEATPVNDIEEFQALFKTQWQEHDQGMQDLESTIVHLLSHKSCWQEDLTLLKDLQIVVIETMRSILREDDIFA